MDATCVTGPPRPVCHRHVIVLFPPGRNWLHELLTPILPGKLRVAWAELGAVRFSKT
jgi:hypothetical protein